MRVKRVRPTHALHVDVDELSALCGAGQSLDDSSKLFAVGDESTNLFTFTLTGDFIQPVPDVWTTTYAGPPGHGSDFEGIAADAHGHVIVLTEFPAGVVQFQLDSLQENHLMSATRVPLDEDSMRHLAGMSALDRLHPEGVVLLVDGHLLVAHEKQPRGLFEMGRPGAAPLGIHPSSYLPAADAFALPAQLVALAWWPLRDGINDISDLAVRDHRLHLLSDESSCVVSLAQDVAVSAELELKTCWRFPDDMKNAEGLVFRSNGDAYVGLDVPGARPTANIFSFALF
jgi:uncharacterized protein YjiK